MNIDTSLIVWVEARFFEFFLFENVQHPQKVALVDHKSSLLLETQALFFFLELFIF